jgi:Leucine-rich repeat (LRR) protein
VPNSFLGNFPKLRVLDLRNGKFDRLPEEVGNLTNLVCLDLSYCINLKILLDIVWKLQKLKCLIIINCWMLKYLPSGLVKLTSLQILNAEGFDTWAEHTPSNIARTESLDHVYPNRRVSLEDICKLVALTKLSTSGVVKLPYNISALTKLKILWLELANVRTLPAKMAYHFNFNNLIYWTSKV